MRKALFPLYLLLYYSLLVTAICSFLLLFLLLGEYQQPVWPEADPAACADHSDELVLNAQGELCQHFLGQQKPVSGRFTATGQLLVRQ